MAYLPIAFSCAFLDENADPIAGATVTVTIRNAAGTAVATAAAMTERTGESGSYYEYIYTPVADTTYTGVASTTAVTATQSWVLIGSATAEQDADSGLTAADVWTYATRTLTTSANVVFIPRKNPLNGFEELIIGNSFTTGVDNDPLDFEDSDFPVLTGASILYKQRHQTYADQTFSKAGSVVNATTARVELTSAETALFLAGVYDVEVIATLSDGTKKTLVEKQIEWVAPISGGV